MFNSFSPISRGQSFRMSRFGSAGIVLRARGNEPLPEAVIRERVPSVYAEDKHESRSEKYTFIPTALLLQQMGNEGFFPMEIRQGGSRDEHKRNFTKHLIRFRRSGVVPVLNETFPEIVLVNSHDGTSSYQLMPGWFRLICSNGLIVSESCGESIKVSHRGNCDDIIEASYRVVNEFPEQARLIEDMRGTHLDRDEQLLLAETAIPFRFPVEEGASPVVTPEQVLRPQRREDVDNSLWTTFNRVQENLTQGGILTTRTDQYGRRNHRRSREVNGIGDNVALNRALWEMTEKFHALKKGN